MIRSQGMGRGVQMVHELTFTDANGQIGFEDVVAGSYIAQATFEEVGMDRELVDVRDNQFLNNPGFRVVRSSNCHRIILNQFGH